METLNAKQEAIKKVYGEYYIHSDINGWMRFGMYCPTDLGIENYDDMDGFWRCKSLQGIENNNGWIKIESEADLPKIGEYDMSSFILYYWTNNGLYRAEDYKRWKIHYDYLQVSHYRLEPIFKPKPPIY